MAGSNHPPPPLYNFITFYNFLTDESHGFKLLQIHTLLKGLEKIAVSADIPMLVCGDFNSTPGRFVRY
jgi:hypothetical protein